MSTCSTEHRAACARRRRPALRRCRARAEARAGSRDRRARRHARQVPRRQVGRMATFALIHGGGGSAWDWHLVARELREAGHDPTPSISRAKTNRPAGGVTPTLSWGPSATAASSSSSVIRSAASPRRSSAPAFPSTCSSSSRQWSRRPASSSQTGGRTRATRRADDDVFYHDVPPELAAEARRRERGETRRRSALAPCGLARHADEVPAGRDDRMFPAAWARRHAHERLGIDPDEMDGSHYIMLSRPRELADRLAAYAAKIL